MRRNGGGASATVGAADAQKKPGNLRCRVSTRERDRMAGFPADGADYLREALVAPLTASSALAWTLAVVDSTWALAIWAMASLAFRVRPNTSWPVLTARSTFSREIGRAHTSELQSLMRISYAVFCLKTKKNNT